MNEETRSLKVPQFGTLNMECDLSNLTKSAFA